MSTHAHRPLGRSRGVARSVRRLTALWGLAGLLAASLLVSCGDSGPAEEVVITTELYQRWRDLPHRISRVELTSSPLTEGTGLRVTAQNDGGAAGVFDRPRVRIGADRWASSRLRSVEGSVVVEIPPHDPTMPALHAASVTASVTAPELAGASSVVAYIRGYRIDTNLYDTPPDFEERIPYDPGYGYTTQGVGIQLGEPSVSGSEITFDVRARNSLGLADRPDMNEAMAEATTWVRVDYVVVGAFGRSNTSRGEAEYTLSYATFGTETAHPHASPATQATTSTSPACTARAARRSAITPLAPPVGTVSSQRAESPRCWVNPTGVSGASEKLETENPSNSPGAIPASPNISRRARAIHQCAVSLL